MKAAPLTIALLCICLLLTLTPGGCPLRGGSTNQNDNAAANGNLNSDDAGRNANSADGNVNGAANANDNAAVNANDNSAPPPIAPGFWEIVSGDLLQNGPVDLAYMALNADHTVDFHYYMPELNIAVGQTGIYSVAGSVLLLGFGTPPTPVMLVFDQPDADTLHLMSDGGDELVLARAAEIPEQFQCLPLTPVHTYTGLPRPHERTGMAYDGSRLWYTTDASVLQAIDPADGTPGETHVLTTPLVHAYQGGAFWVISGSGAMEQAEHRRLDNTLLDEIDTRVDLGEANRIEVLAWESRDNVLWVHGSLPDHSADRFLRVACLGEPDELLGVDEFDVAISAMSWHGRELWAIVSGMVVQLDMTALRGEVTYRVDLPGIRWRGIAWAGDAMFLIGANDDGGVLVEVDPG
jgi:hypothetical protein